MNFNPLLSAHRKQDDNKPILIKLQPWKKTHDQFRRIVMKADSGFNLQPQKSSEDDESKNEMSKMEFTVQEASTNAEFWASALLRAENLHKYDGLNERDVDIQKKQDTEVEFHAVLSRYNPHDEIKDFCIIAVKNEEKNVNLTPEERIVGTLDLIVHILYEGQKFPWEPQEPSSFLIYRVGPNPRIYGVLDSVCVAKSARRQGVATKMLRFAIETAKSQGIDKVCLRVQRENKAAWELYQRMGFQEVECPVFLAEGDQLTWLLLTV